jgi:hypothetical protein
MEANPEEIRKFLKTVHSGKYLNTGGPILGLASSCKEPTKAEETNLGPWWIPEESERHSQMDVLLCPSCMAKEM